MLKPLMARVGLAPWDQDRFLFLQILCGYERCGVLGELQDTHRPPRDIGPWVLFLSDRYAETAPGSGIWRWMRRRPRRPRATWFSTGHVQGRRDRDGHLFLAGPGVGRSTPDAPAVVQIAEGPLRRPDGQIVRADQLVGPTGRITPAELILVCPTGHHSRVTVPHITEEVAKLRASWTFRQAEQEQLYAELRAAMTR